MDKLTNGATAAVDIGARTLLTPEQAAELLQVPAALLARWRTKASDVPIPFVKLGHRTVRYRLGDLLAYIDDAARGGRPHCNGTGGGE